MKKIERERNLLVAFSKRKSGIYNKASELSTLCGALVDILMISPAGKPYCYREPSSQSIARTILKNENPSVEEKLKQLKINEVNTKNDELNGVQTILFAAISCIDELNGVQTNPPYVFGANNNGYEIGASKKSHSNFFLRRV